MYIVDDPTLALIARFLGDVASEAYSDEEFFNRQLSAVEAYVEGFPEDERDARALEWIESNAMHYRQQWQKQTAISTLASRRCPDCPLAGGHQEKPCAIHRRWLRLLERYAADKLSSHEYVDMSLALLAAHKSWLKVTRRREPADSARSTALYAS
jgi:hypothetical protein